VTLVTSLKSASELSINPGLWISQPTLENYLQVLTHTDRFNIYSYLFNSTIASLIGTSLAILLAFPAAYAIARSEAGKRTLLP
ncbi:carbohydrate ABC transporter permease, partial [Variovorax sp. 2RAF20]